MFDDICERLTADVYVCVYILLLCCKLLVGFNAIVGTAISASLLPPIVNSGLCLGFGLMHWLNARVSDHDTYRFARLGVMSLVLWFTNFCMILIVGYLTFR